MGVGYSGDTYSDLQAAYRYFFEPQSTSGKDLNGFHPFNSGALGIYRDKEWAVSMGGLTSRIWGTEIYDAANVFGRYQSYGSLEVMYNGQDVLSRSGYPTAATIPWDWNVVPGTTTVHLDWKNLAPNKTRADEYQEKNFAGALSAGKEGIFALDFVEKPNHYTSNGLQFKKTVVAFDGLLLCLGSDITASNASDKTATNLFQNIVSSKTGSLYVDGTSGLNGNVQQTLPMGENHWLVNPSGTAYFIPEGNDAIQVWQGEQSAPNQNNKYNASSFVMTRNEVAKAWIDHGVRPFNKKYHFVVVPGISPSLMQDLAPGLVSGGGKYTILVQQNNAHIVRLDELKKTAYVVFSRYPQIAVGKVQSVESPCLLMTDESETSRLRLFISLPEERIGCIKY